MATITKVKTGSIGPDGKPIFDIFEGATKIDLTRFKELKLNIEQITEGDAPSGFVSEFKPVSPTPTPKLPPVGTPTPTRPTPAPAPTAVPTPTASGKTIYNDFETFVTATTKKYGKITPAGGISMEQYWQQQRTNLGWMQGLESFAPFVAPAPTPQAPQATLTAPTELGEFFKVPTGSVGPQGEQIFDIFRQDGSQVLAEQAAGLGLTKEVIEGLQTGASPQGFQSEFLPATSNVEANIEQATGDIDLGDVSTFGTDALTPAFSATDIQQLMDDLTPTSQAPQAPDLVDTFAELRGDEGIPELETKLNQLKGQLANVEAGLRLGLQEVEGQLVSTRLIDVEQLELRRQAQENIDFVTRQINSVVDELNTKNSMISTIMDLTQQSFQNASTVYQNEFNNTLDAINLFNEQKSLVEKKAMANWQLLANQYESVGLTWDTLNPEQQQQVESLAIRSGNPGLSQFIGAGQGEIRNILSRTDASGNAFIDIIRQLPDGSISIESQFRGTGGGISGGGADTKEEKIITNFRKSLVDQDALLEAGDREQFIRLLTVQYPQIEPSSIAEYVYGTYPDGFDI